MFNSMNEKFHVNTSGAQITFHAHAQTRISPEIEKKNNISNKFKPHDTYESLMIIL